MNTAMISGQGAGEGRLPERRERSDAQALAPSPAAVAALPSRKIRVATAVVWALVCLAGALMIASLVRVILDPEAAGPQEGNEFQWVAGVTCTAIGGVVAAIHTHNRVAWLLLAIGTLSAVSLFIGAYASLAPTLEWVEEWIWWPEIGLVPFAFLLFPDGRLPSHRWRFCLWISVFGLAVPAVALAAAAIVQPGVLFQPDEARGPRAVLLIQTAEVGLLVSLLAALLAVISLVVRFRAIVGGRTPTGEVAARRGRVDAGCGDNGRSLGPARGLADRCRRPSGGHRCRHHEVRAVPDRPSH